MGAVGEGELGPGDGRDLRDLGGAGELHRAEHAVVVGEGEGTVAQIGGRGDEILRHGCAVEEREAGVEVEFDVVAHR